MAILISKCSKYRDIEMPEFPDSSESPPKGMQSIANNSSITVTPIPNETDRNIVCYTTTTNEKNSVTPHPGDAKKADSSSSNTNIPNGQTKPTNKPNKQMLETHRKWQEAAEAMGGPGARIVVSKPDAKKLIFDLLYDEFCPMNITDIYKVSTMNYMHYNYFENAH